MPQWIYNRPPEKCDETEIRLAKLLNDQLGDDWIIRWGYWYHDNNEVLREGDFLIQAPSGGVLVLEVKTSLHHMASTGHWAESDGDNPVTQLLAQHAGVIRKLGNAAKGRHVPWVAKSLALPAIEVAANISEFRSVPRELIVAGNDLRDFAGVWRRLFAARRDNAAEDRQVFLDAFGEGVEPKNVRSFISETDKLILQQATANYRLLDMLSGNLQLVVEGGAGTGKSWHAIDQARRLAEDLKGANGREVLLMTYNLALGERLKASVSKLRLKRGRITVRNSEELAADILAACDIAHEVPSDRILKQGYFDEVLPALAREALTTEFKLLGHLLGRFDALVVDEAQDHDTQLTDDPDSDEQCGWWGIYVRLLKNGWSSPMAIFGDNSQRPPFRAADRFSFDRLRHRLAQHAHLRLDTVLRYTRQIFLFLKSLDAEGTHGLVEGLRSAHRLLDGPEVVLRDSPARDAARTVEGILDDWRASGCCTPSKVLILYDRSTIDNTALAGLGRLLDHELRPFMEIVDTSGHGCIGHSSIHKAKGLDSLGVILVGLRPFEQLDTPYDRFTYFMGASRARQLLACVHVIETTETKHS